MFRHHICPRCRRQYLAEAPGCPHCGTTRAQRFAAGLRDITRRLTAPTGAPHTPGQRIDPAGATDAEGPHAADAPGPITACRHCQQRVSRDAKTCPHCGASAPAQNRWERATTELFKPGTLVGIAALYLLITWSTPAPPPTTEQTAQAARDAAAAAAAEATCRANAVCWGKRHADAASSACRRATERYGKHAVRWPGIGLIVDFAPLKWADTEQRSIYYIGQAEFQNGFGAWTPYVSQCLVDIRTDTALDVQLMEGRL